MRLRRTPTELAVVDRPWVTLLSVYCVAFWIVPIALYSWLGFDDPLSSALSRFISPRDNGKLLTELLFLIATGLYGGNEIRIVLNRDTNHAKWCYRWWGHERTSEHAPLDGVLLVAGGKGARGVPRALRLSRPQLIFEHDAWPMAYDFLPSFGRWRAARDVASWLRAPFDPNARFTDRAAD
ncbi:MAG: hypothetical protein MI723_14730 [Caulobacterales bacterium]|nr:hypothetical protein [Caulobacterales bacterium]